jgi:hypothetical protein
MNAVQLFIDHHLICALIGPDPQAEIAGHGRNVPAALRDLAREIESRNYRVPGLDQPPDSKRKGPWLMK